MSARYSVCIQPNKEIWHGNSTVMIKLLVSQLPILSLKIHIYLFINLKLCQLKDKPNYCLGWAIDLKIGKEPNTYSKR